MRGKHGRRALGALAAIALGVLAFPSTGHAEPISGKWVGEVEDTNAPGAPYKTRIAIDDKLKRGTSGGTSEYPAFDCGDKLIFLKVKNSGAFVFEEKLTFGEEL